MRHRHGPISPGLLCLGILVKADYLVYFLRFEPALGFWVALQEEYGPITQQRLLGA
jgi:hypothetical protein